MKRIGLKVATFFLLVGVKCLSISAQPADIVERMRAKDDSIMFKALFDLALTDGHAITPKQTCLKMSIRGNCTWVRPPWLQ